MPFLREMRDGDESFDAAATYDEAALHLADSLYRYRLVVLRLCFEPVPTLVKFAAPA
ncbi:hypothetical protein SDC9_176442 [bioreactor metagenome]|uniref:Uncharacterized protein n=1 Tax=bioreactor metagenome TaxID=1076179 RepID=A0A645GQN7_9ZZZZ